jgi:ubiquinone/menaquinone biosynthesis C-methylase UbiE
MIDLDRFFSSSAKELEDLPWYDFMSKIGLQSFNVHGNKSVDLIAKITQLTKESRVLMVGCGAGSTAVHLAEITEAMIYGIDLAPESIRTANILASKSSAKDRLNFQIKDAHSLDFEPNTFDVIITEYMAFFLRPEAFKGFFRVLKPKGVIALAELIKDPTVNKKADQKILTAEHLYSELLMYQFHIPSITDYTTWLTQSGFQNVHVEQTFPYPKSSEVIKRVGGWKMLFKISKIVFKLMRESPKIKEKFMKQSKVKRILYQSKATAKFILQGVMIGQKP